MFLNHQQENFVLKFLNKAISVGERKGSGQ